jgi:hypothetical protein
MRGDRPKLLSNIPFGNIPYSWLELGRAISSFCQRIAKAVKYL